MERFNDNRYYKNLLVSQQTPSKRSRYISKNNVDGKVDENISGRNLVVIEHEDEVVCVLKPDAGSSRSLKQVKEVKEKFRNKKVSVVGTNENVIEISSRAKTDAYIFDGL